MTNEAQKSLRIFDTHLHLFDLQQGEYAWLNKLPAKLKSIIAKDFTALDLRLPSDFTLAGFVHIEAGFDNNQPWRELIYLEQTYLEQSHLKHSNSEQGTKLPFCSIACVDLLQSPDEFANNIALLSEHSSFVGVRHILDDQALQILREPNAKKNLALLNQRALVFELQIKMIYEDSQSTESSKQQNELLSVISEVFRPLSNLRIVLNHAGFMPINSGSASFADNYKTWQNAILSLADLPNLHVKCSGWEMTSHDYAQHDIEKGLGFLLESFGSARVMLASNFPLVLFAKSYAQYWVFMKAVVTNLNEDFEALSYTNSKRLYLEPLQ